MALTEDKARTIMEGFRSELKLSIPQFVESTGVSARRYEDWVNGAPLSEGEYSALNQLGGELAVAHRADLDEQKAKWGFTVGFNAVNILNGKES